MTAESETSGAAQLHELNLTVDPAADWREPKTWPSNEPVQITSWNRFSRRFIDPPVFELATIPNVAKYVAVVRQDENMLRVESAQPRLDLAGIWARIEHDFFELSVELHSAEGPLASFKSIRMKSWDWQGFDGKNLDWVAAADRNIAWLIDSAKNGIAPYRETGVPVWVWSAAGPEVERGNPQGFDVAYPALHMPSFIRAFLAHAELNRPQRDQAMKLARYCGDWLLKYRHADEGMLPLFPYSTIGLGRFEGGNEGKAVNLLRASYMATVLVELYGVTQQEGLLDYAARIADVTMRFQRHDGSFPYRVDPATGEVVEPYSCYAIDFVELVEMLEGYRPDVRRALAARRALDWTLAYPTSAHHWQATFEDVRENAPFENLMNMAPIQLIRYLCRNAAEHPKHLSIARELNRWVEDQFVVFRYDDTVGHDIGEMTLRGSGVQNPCPMVLEQYRCYFVMEYHTANWIVALMELHRATGEDTYLDKARAAANAICASQFDNGEFSTWGHDPKTGKRASTHSNWYGCNALASWVLYRFSDYVRRLEA